MWSRTSVLTILSLLALGAIPVAAAEPALSAAGDLSGAEVGVPVQVTVNLTGAANGISGYNISASLEDGDVAEITAISFPSWATLHSNGSLPSAYAWASGADLGRGVETGSDTVNLLTITITPKASGTTSLIITPAKIDDDIGGRYALPDLEQQFSVGNTAFAANSGGSDDNAVTATATPTTASTTIVTESPRAAGTQTLQETETALRTPSTTIVETTAEPLTETPQQTAGIEQSILVACGLAIAGVMLYRRKR